MELAERSTRALSSRTDVAADWLLGSRARGTEKDASDVDVAARSKLP